MDWKTTLASSTAAAVMMLAAQDTWSHDTHAHHAKPAAPAMGKQVKLGDVQLQDQDGRKLRLASDVVGDKLVVVTFVFTNCTDTCPTVSHTFAQVQEKLGPLMEQRVRLVSLSVDPARDTPARLKEYAALFDAKPGWLWLTGEPARVSAALQGFGVTVQRPEMHPAQVLIGDPRTNRWTRLYTVDNAQQIVAKVHELLASPCTPAPSQAGAGAAKPGCGSQPG